MYVKCVEPLSTRAPATGLPPAVVTGRIVSIRLPVRRQIERVVDPNALISRQDLPAPAARRWFCSSHARRDEGCGHTAQIGQKFTGRLAGETARADEQEERQRGCPERASHSSFLTRFRGRSHRAGISLPLVLVQQSGEPVHDLRSRLVEVVQFFGIA